MAMTQEEIRDFWKLGASLSEIPAEVEEPQILDARMHYEQLKDKMLSEIAAQRDGSQEDEAEQSQLTTETAIAQLDAVLVAFTSLVSMIPQLIGDPKTAEVIDNGKAASKWLHENLDSLKKPEK